MENRFGVCYCDIWLSRPSSTKDLSDLVIFDTYEEAFNCYIDRLREMTQTNHLYIPDNLWIVWVDKESNRITQFTKLEWTTRCKLVNLD